MDRWFWRCWVAAGEIDRYRARLRQIGERALGRRTSRFGLGDLALEARLGMGTVVVRRPDEWSVQRASRLESERGRVWRSSRTRS